MGSWDVPTCRPKEKGSPSCFAPLWSLFLSPSLPWSPHEIRSLLETNQLDVPKILLVGCVVPSLP